jgi:hypothetical protein
MYIIENQRYYATQQVFNYNNLLIVVAWKIQLFGLFSLDALDMMAAQ